MNDTGSSALDFEPFWMYFISNCMSKISDSSSPTKAGPGVKEDGMV